jgi:hypothetical protein
VTEREWERCESPERMLDFLAGRASARKLRLFGVAWCRSLSPRLAAEGSRHAVEVAERFADGRAGPDELAACAGAAFAVAAAAVAEAAAADRAACSAGALQEAYPEWDGPTGPYRRAEATYHAALAAVAVSAAVDGSAAAGAAAGAAPLPFAQTYQRSMQGSAQASLLRDLFNPFRPVPVDPAWLAWRGGAIPSLAQAVYEGRALPSGHLDAARLAVLADLLEEAGCADAELLGHLRGPGPHVRGCFAIDALLGKA